jgi:hypothetical protein
LQRGRYNGPVSDGWDDFLETDAALATFLARFEDGSWPIAEWRHKHHLAVAACYLAEGNAVAMDRLRSNIKRYNVSQGGENTEDRGYHETITRFWVEVVSRYVASLQAGLQAGLPMVEIARLVVAKFESRRDLFREYYDFDVVKSREARAAWIPPSRPFEA